MTDSVFSLWHRNGSSFCCSVLQSCPTLCNPMDCSTQSMSFTISWSLLKLMSIESVLPSNYLILCHPLLLLPSIFPSNRVFSNESVLCIRRPKYWSFSFNISPSNEYSGRWQVGFPCSLRDPQESSPAPQFKRINYLALSFLYSPSLTSMPDYWIWS